MKGNFTMCSPCGKFFTGTTAFDKHRVGRHEPLERRCLSEWEMLHRGFSLDERGRWGLRLSEAAQTRLAALRK